MSSWETVLALLGLAVITVGTRGFFLYPERELPMPAWLKQGLRYAPLAALAAVVAPELVMSQGHLITTLKDARIYATLAASILAVALSVRFGGRIDDIKVNRGTSRGQHLH